MNILILGGTRQARELARSASGERGFEIVSSLAGRVRDPLLPAGEVRIGGFGGPDGLREFLLGQRIDVVVDATHPFADTITGNAAIACRAAGIPLLRLSRPGWSAGPGDNWIRVPDLAAAAARVTELGERIFLTIGRQGVGAFAGHSDRWFLIRAIDPPDAALPAHHELLLARGPFTVEAESELLARHRIDVLVTKDSGGADTAAKLTAARAARIPVLMVDRPATPGGIEVVGTVPDALEWLRRRAASGR
ncbi:cobalt-precorrin-6A reductase [Nocardia cyriacigeorgica]|uniref:cobalt-precorrin-6A reductase n=1 Tax=Nocardia cyriacigeorgica TaxID=135487 RepID=UPI00056A16D8|nr:cobalt-precorrin-6A reductase [Nocardia cyriacigeorgica]AVH23344.1 cobalt-precorrin-6A reductase [Nocardia cyriacigeorgica]PPJ10228.1 cobalt-precorrin-6A reductase [Nocardia cyriacigeorgica]TLF54403.1 cobalt-precorrin-6A reductase [Nocardia cyriacigeorgica]